MTADSESVDAVLTASRALLGVVANSMGEALEQVTLPQFRALTILTTSDPMSARTLADRMGIAASTMSRSADRMVASGWIRREANADDRRETLLVPTDRARSLIADVAARRRRRIAEVLDGVPEDGLSAVRAGFEAFAAAAHEPVVVDPELLGL